MQLKLIRYLLGIAIIALVISCETTQECYQPTTVTVKAAFVVKNTYDSLIVTDTSARDTTIISHYDTFMAAPYFQSLGLDSTVGILGAKGTSLMPLPLNPDAGNIRYLVVPDTADFSVIDTLTIFYTPQVHFISNSCGYTYYYNIDSVHNATALFDSVALANREVTTLGNVRHILLYFFTQ